MNAFAFLTSRSTPALEHVSAGIDRSFLDNVQGTFGGWGLSSQTLDIIGWTLAVACLAAGAVILVNQKFFKPRRHVPSGVVNDPGQVGELLTMAMDQRSKVEFSFSRDEQAARSLHCSIEELKKGTLVLDAGNFATVHQGWLGRPVICYFRVMPRTGSGQPQFYNFESEISGVVKRTDGSALISIPLPATLTLQQKRIHLRMEPPVDCLLGLALWPEPLTGDGRPEPTIRRWGKPLLVYHQQKTGQIRVANVSAGGMRVDVPRESVKRAGCEFETGERHVVLLKLKDPEKDARERLWCLARIQNRYEDYETRTLELGLRFLAVGAPSGDESPVISWRNVGASGIDRLGNWIQRRHLERFRSRGAI